MQVTAILPFARKSGLKVSLAFCGFQCLYFMTIFFLLMTHMVVQAQLEW